MLDEMIDGCGSVLGIKVPGFDSHYLWENGDFGFHGRKLALGAPG